MARESALQLVAIAKRFGAVDALKGVDFELERGEVHGLLGENGAGKSTLMQIAFGLVKPDAGSVAVGGRAVRIGSPLEARALGLGMVHQHFTSIPTLTVRENLELAGWAEGPARNAGGVRETLARGLDPAALVEELTVGQQQRLEVLKALATDARVLLLDEPTAVLAPSEVAELLGLLREFAGNGGSAVLITHKLEEAFAAVDRVTVLRRGMVTYSGAIAGQTPASLARAMLGDEPKPDSGRSPPAVPGEIRVRADGVDVRAGEIVGIAAVEGNGQRRFLRAVAGLEPADDVSVSGPAAFVPEDRTVEGLIPGFSLTENLVLGASEDPRWSRGPWLDWRAAGARTEQLIEEFEIRAAGPRAPARSLSGGNQQKVIFARALEGDPAVLVAENPSRGLDLKATGFVHGKLRDLAARGVAVLVYSSDLDEVLALADRVVVWYRGRPIPVAAGASRDEVGRLMLGGQ
ncbi:MAG: ATP-binding cassette domain-containing protein [Gemmatimonadales bacterium]